MTKCKNLHHFNADRAITNDTRAVWYKTTENDNIGRIWFQVETERTLVLDCHVQQRIQILQMSILVAVEVPPVEKSSRPNHSAESLQERYLRINRMTRLKRLIEA